MSVGPGERPPDTGNDLLVTVEGNATLAPEEFGPSEGAELGISAARSPGDQVGRYLLVERIGRGGMGVVYSAYDPELDRKVALKLVRPDSTSTSGGSRLQREAQAMARLSHPNVITVHDVGTLEEGSVFIAMEFVDGPTLAEWQREAGRTPDEVLEVYVKAGRGLAAAHDAKLVHRDFKPENVLIGSRGRVRVLDFGLARQEEGSRGSGPYAAPQIDRGKLQAAYQGQMSTMGGSGSLLGSGSGDLTRTGALLGTPAYMAPEQHSGEHVDSRSDQFAFCVALWEAIYGQRPFPGESLTALAFSVLSGELRKAPDGSSVPERVRVALEKGLSNDPKDRWPSMHELLAALEPPPERRASGLLVGLGAVSVVLALGLGLFLGDTEEAPRCAKVDHELREFWQPARVAQIGQAFSATGLPFADDAWKRVRSRLDTWTGEWTSVRTETCEATLVHEEQSESLMDLRMACLSEQLAEVRGVVDRLAQADARAVEFSTKAVEQLPNLDLCSDAEGLLAAVPPPGDPKTAADVEEVRKLVSAVSASTAAGDQDEARKLAEDAYDKARRIDYPPALAEAAMAAASTRRAAYEFDSAEAALNDAILSAESTGDARAGARAWITMLGIRGGDKYEKKLAHEAADHARAYLTRFAPSDPMQATFLRNWSTLLEWEGKYRESIEQNEKALAIVAQHEGELSLQSSQIYTALGNGHWELGAFDEALRLHEKAHEIDLRVLGPAHPSVADGLSNMGIIHDEHGDYRKAREFYEQAIAIVENAGQADAGALGVYHNNIASTFIEESNWKAAAEHYETAREQWTRAYGPSHPNIAMVLTNLALVDENKGDLSASLAKYDRAIEIQTKHFGAKHRETAWSQAARADVLRLLGRTDDALAVLHPSIELSIAAVGADHEDVAQERVHLGRVYLDLGRYQEAREQFESVVENRMARLDENHPSVLRPRGLAAVARYESGDREGARLQLEAVVRLLPDKGAEDDSQALAYFAFARSIADSDPQRALEHAMRAMAFYEKAPAHYEGERARVEAFVRRMD